MKKKKNDLCREKLCCIFKHHIDVTLLYTLLCIVFSLDVFIKFCCCSRHASDPTSLSSLIYENRDDSPRRRVSLFRCIGSISLLFRLVTSFLGRQHHSTASYIIPRLVTSFLDRRHLFSSGDIISLPAASYHSSRQHRPPSDGSIFRLPASSSIW